MLVLSGVTKKSDLVNFGYSPFVVLNGIGDLPPKDESKS